jgi:DNA-binding LacI/PurR family transcriptional regulator
MSRQITIKDIARHLGVSSATVSLALNNAPGVNEETRRRVKEHAERLRYRPNASARAITTGRTYLIAVVVARLTDSFFQEIVQGIENVAYRNGYDVIVNTVGDGSQPESVFIERLIGRRIDGLIGWNGLPSTAGLARLDEAEVPVLLLLPETQGARPQLCMDNRLGGRLAAVHLLALGHRRILFVGGDDIHSDLRAEGAAAALAEQGLTLSYCRLPGMFVKDMAEVAHTHFRERLRRGDWEHTALFCSMDVLAVGAYRALAEAGLRVPQDVSVVGFDDMRWTSLLTPPLTTVHQPQVSQGEAAMQMLTALMEGQNVPNRSLQPRLVIRESTGPVSE